MATRKPLVIVSGQVQEQPAGDVPAGAEPSVTAGTAAQFWRGDKSWRDFATDVRAAVLTGLSTATNAAIAATDTVLAALGKLQAQLNNAVFLTGNQTVGGNKSFTSSVLLTGAGALGYGTGAGGTATQPTDKNTAVTINKPSGLITMAAGVIAANSAVAFQVVNSTVATGDTVSVNLIGGLTTGGSGYVLDAQAPATGSFYIVVRNTTGTAMPSGDQPQLQFNVHKGARS